MTDENESPLLVGKHFETPAGTAYQYGENGNELVLATDFDFDAVDRGNPLLGLGKDKIAIGAEMLHALVAWWAESCNERVAARKLFVTCYVLRPDLFTEKSQARFAENRGFSKQLFNRYRQQFENIAPGFRGKSGWKEDSRESYRRKREKPVAATQPAPEKQTKHSNIEQNCKPEGGTR